MENQCANVGIWERVDTQRYKEGGMTKQRGLQRKLQAASYCLSRWWLLYLDATEVAVAFDIEGFETVRLLGVAVAVHASESGVDVVLDADVSVDTDLDAAEIAVERDDSAVHDVGILQVEAGEAKAGMYLGAFETLAAVAVVLLAETHVNLVHLAAVHDDGLWIVGCVVTMAATAFLVEKQQRDAPYHGRKANHELPNIVPVDDIACRQKQQDADTEADDGADFVLVVEDIDEAWHNDE